MGVEDIPGLGVAGARLGSHFEEGRQAVSEGAGGGDRGRKFGAADRGTRGERLRIGEGVEDVFRALCVFTEATEAGKGSERRPPLADVSSLVNVRCCTGGVISKRYASPYPVYMVALVTGVVRSARKQRYRRKIRSLGMSRSLMVGPRSPRRAAVTRHPVVWSCQRLKPKDRGFAAAACSWVRTPRQLMTASELSAPPRHWQPWYASFKVWDRPLGGIKNLDANETAGVRRDKRASTHLIFRIIFSKSRATRTLNERELWRV